MYLVSRSSTESLFILVPFLPTVPPHSVHFARAIARPWVSTLGRFGHILVEEGSGFFMRYCGSKWVDGKVFKNRVENWKIAFLAFFVNLVKCPILPNKVPFFLFLTQHGDGRDWYRHNWIWWVGYLGHKPAISKQKITNWDSCPNVTSQIITFAQCSGFQTNLIVL